MSQVALRYIAGLLYGIRFDALRLKNLVVTLRSFGGACRWQEAETKFPKMELKSFRYNDSAVELQNNN
jgi:hypothetical protein